MNATSSTYRLESDTLPNTSLLEIGNQNRALSTADPLWLLYYSKELRPVLEHSMQSIMAPLPAVVRGKVISEGLYAWYDNELKMLKERIEGAKSSNVDRGARILAYHRMLMEYRALSAAWANRTATAQVDIKSTEKQQHVKAGIVNPDGWTSATDVEIAREVIRSRKY